MKQLTAAIPLLPALCALLMITRFSLADSPPQQSELFNFVMSKIEERQAQLQTIRCNCSIQLSRHIAGVGQLDVSINARVARKGDAQAIEYKKRTLAKSTQDRQEQGLRTVLTRSYLAFRDDERPMAEQVMLENAAQPPARAQTATLLHGEFNPLAYGFGDGNVSAANWNMLSSSIARWEIVEANEAGHKVYHLTRFSQGANDRPDALWVVDPSMGYLITQVVDYDERGEVIREMAVVPSEVAGAGWFPQQVSIIDRIPNMSSEVRSTLKKETDDDIVRTEVLRFDAYEINQPIPDDEFSVKFLRLPPNAMILRTHADGTKETLQLTNGLLLPQDVAREWDIEKPVKQMKATSTVPSSQDAAVAGQSYAADIPDGPIRGKPVMQNSRLRYLVVAGAAALLLLIMSHWRRARRTRAR